MTASDIFNELTEKFRIKRIDSNASSNLSPIQWGIICIIFVYSVSRVIKNALYSNDNPNPNMNDFISYSIQYWCWILIIIIIYSMFVL